MQGAALQQSSYRKSWGAFWCFSAWVEGPSWLHQEKGRKKIPQIRNFFSHDSSEHRPGGAERTRQLQLEGGHLCRMMFIHFHAGKWLENACLGWENQLEEAPWPAGSSTGHGASGAMGTAGTEPAAGWSSLILTQRNQELGGVPSPLSCFAMFLLQIEPRKCKKHG